MHGRKTTARCPACAEAGHDQTRNHLFIQVDGRFGCVVYPGDSPEAREHRKRIFALCANREIKSLVVRRSDLGRSGRVDQSHPAGELLKTGLLGRLGRLFQTHSGTEQAHEEKEDRGAENLNDCEKGVPSVLNMLEVEPHKPPVEREWPRKRHLLTMARWPFVMVYSKALGEIIVFCKDEDTKAALVEAGASPWSIYTKAELRQLVQQNRIAPLSQAELRKLHEIKRTFDARINTE